jgi:AraC family transcriptional regulator, dual regulator of chb operon
MLPSSPSVLRLADYAPLGAAFHFARRHFEFGGLLPEHAHEFSEIVWVESGSGIHTIDARRENLVPGWIRLIEPRDVHGIRGSWTDSLCIANLAFRPEELAPLAARFGPEAGYHALDLLRSGGLILRGSVLRILQQEASRLPLSRLTSLDLVRLLTALLAEIEEFRLSETVQHDLPAWLARARSLMEHNEELLAGGLTALCDIAHRTPDHINRSVRRYYGTTTTGLVNDLRLDHAEFLLCTTDRTITDVALSSGFANGGHFHARFRQRTGITPRAYRNRAQGTLRT